MKNQGYQRPSGAIIDTLKIPDKMKLMATFLYPVNDRCLHVRRTLDQFYYSTLPEADRRTIDQVVYKFAMKQSRKQEKEQEEAAERQRKKDEEARRKMTQGSNRSYKGGKSETIQRSNTSNFDTEEGTLEKGAQSENGEPRWTT
jgi:hypothetical protein